MAFTQINDGTPRLRGVLFDMDGVVIDTEKLYTRFWMAAARDLGFPMTLEQALQLRSLGKAPAQAKLDSFFVDADSRTLTLPAVTVPENQTFAGWVKQEDDGNGKITLTIVFTPDESNTVILPGNGLEPMTLYTLFMKE